LREEPRIISILDAPWPRVVFGVGAVTSVPDEVRRLGARAVFLVVDVSARSTGDAIAAVLGDIVADRVSEVVMHVPVNVAHDAVGRAQGIDLLVSVGGGSATGLAKAVALETGLPILAVPTTYAGSEMTPVWGLTEVVDGVPAKRTGRDARVRPRVVVYDPALTVSLPPGLSAASGLNAMAHLMAGLFAAGAVPVVGALAEEGVRALAGALPRVVAAPDDLDARSDALYGAWLAGWVLGATATGLHHKMCHVLGGRYNLPHAEVHAAMLPYTTAFLAREDPAAPSAMARAARALGGGDPAGAIYDLARSIGAPTSLASTGFDLGQVSAVATDVATALAPPSTTPPGTTRPITDHDIRELLLAAYDGKRP
jgi:maleylacetate reductase